jgi:uncharacterized PurR-regulated membrane protein YhhQ (DUF165 family)
MGALTFDDGWEALSRDEAAERRDLVIGESDRRDERTLKTRMRRGLAQFLERLVIVTGLSIFVLPLLLAGIATLDLPLGWFDGWATRRSLAASNWLSRGEGLLALSVLLLVLMTRRYGALIVSRVQGLSWLLTVGIAAGMIAYLAPELSESDLPKGRYVIAVVLAWYAGQQFAVQAYDAMRGGAWWRAPFYAALFGFGIQVALFFPIAYAGTGLPWPAWAFLDFCLKVLLAAAFLLPYRLLRRRIRPRGGLGGLA